MVRPGRHQEGCASKICWVMSKVNIVDTLNDQIGGGLAVGLAALAGGAYYAHEQHKESEEGAKAQAWEIQNWILGARERTNKYLEQGPQGPVTWVLSEFFTDRPQLRNDLFPGGEEGGQPWFIARAPHKVCLPLRLPKNVTDTHT